MQTSIAGLISLKFLTHTKQVASKALAAFLLMGMLTGATLPTAQAATNVDLSVSAYTWTPDPVVNGGTSTFSVTVTNNDVVTAADTLSLVVNLPSNLNFSTSVTTSTLPIGCTLNGSSTLLTCTKATLAAQGVWNLAFSGVGSAAGVQPTTASVSSSTNTDPNSGNDDSTKNTTVINGADLVITKTGPTTALADSVISFTVHVANDGPDPATTFRVIDNLPATVDFTYQSASGTDWTCVYAAGALPTLTCDYSGASIASGSSAPDITVTGRIILTTGNITNGASVASTDFSTGDPKLTNNGPSVALVTVTQTTNLRANKTMLSVATNSTGYAFNEAVSLKLSVSNQGPRNATGVTIVDIVPTGFVIGDLTSTGCSAAGQVITCTVGNLANGVTSSIFTIPLTSPGTASSGTNTATPARTTPSAGLNTTGSVNYTVSAAAANLVASKAMVSTANGSTNYAFGEAVTLTLSVNNSGPQNATGVTIVDVVPADFVIGDLTSTGCSAAGQTLTCNVGNLANGASSSNFVIPLTAPSTPSSGANTVTPARATPSAGNNTPATVNYAVVAPVANLVASKAMVSTANGTTSYAYGEAVTLTLSVKNNGPQNATVVTITDDVPAGFGIVSMPGTCVASGQVITCTVTGALNNGIRSPYFVINLTAPNTDSSGTNTATPARSTPSAGTNTPATVSYTVAAPYANLEASKSMISAAPGSTNGTTTYVVGFGVTLTLSATNNGLHDATGVVLSDTIAPEFSIGAPLIGCTALGQVVSCPVGNLANGAKSASFIIPLTALSTTVSGTNTATISRTSPTLGTNTPASVTYSIIEPYAHLTLTKGKTPALVSAGANLTNTILVTNSATSSSPATGTIRVTDALSVNETYVGNGGNGWTCSAAGTPEIVTCDYVLGSPLARTASLAPLVITTQAGATWLGNLANTACTGLSAGSPHLPADNASSCATVTIYGTPRHVDLAIAKTANIPHVLASNTNFSYTLRVSNAATDIAPTVNVSDTLPAFITGGSPTTGSAVITGAVVGESCSFSATVTCTLLNVTKDFPRDIVITVNRPVTAGSYTNTATLTTPDAIDTVGPKQASAAITIDPLVDIAITNIASAPNPVKVGVPLTYTTSITNFGPGDAPGVVLRQRINLAAWLPAARRMNYITGSAAIVGATGATCSFGTFGAGIYAGDDGIECSGFSLSNGESHQLVFKVMPAYYSPTGYPDALNQSCSPAAGSTCAPFVSDATITTSTSETDAPTLVNNSRSNTVQVIGEVIDLTVTDDDPTYDPVAFGDYIVYQITAKNNGPSQATGFKLTVTPTPPALSQPVPYTMVYNAGTGTVLPSGANCNPVGADVVCYLGADQASSVQAASTIAVFSLRFDTGPGTNAPLSSITYKTTVKVESYETGPSPFVGDKQAGNNSVPETTTVLPKTDLQIISKTVSKAVVDLNEEFFYIITVGNKGPSDASGIRVTDVLPAGFVRTSSAIVVTGAGLTTNSCSGPALGANGTLTCDLGPILNDSSGTDTAKQVTISIPVRAAYQVSGTYSFGFNANITNTATIAPLPNTSIDTTPGNNSNSVVVQVRKNSIAGSVYFDNDLNDTMLASGAEGLNAVTLTLTGTDSYGFTYGSGMVYAALTATTAGAGAVKGSFLFDKLPPGSWTLVETQISGYSDRFETVGTAGGTAPLSAQPSDCNGSTNCSSSAAANTISAITLPANAATVASGYIFQEYKNATVSGFVYYDANNDGSKDGSETGIGSVGVGLAGLDYANQSVILIAITDGTGAYSFSMPPANFAGYMIAENQPVTHLNGKTTAGTATGTSAVAGTATGANSDVIEAIKVYSNGTSPNNNFGELLAATISGYVFIDSLPTIPDAQRDAVNETAGISGLTMTLTGTDDLGASVNTTTVTGASGAYNFSNLRPGIYTVTQTTAAAGLTHSGAQAGSKGGTIAGTARAANVGVTGLTNNDISVITLVSSDNATGYNFGESGQGLSGFVYVDLNGNGVKDTGEFAISGAGVTLSGNTTSGQNVCAAIAPNSCTVTTNASGQYGFVGVPASNGSGYTLTEQSQSALPLSDYADGLEQVGTGLATPGVAGGDVFSGIILPVGGVGVNYNFGELAAKLSGTVYHDANNNGTNDSEAGIGGVTLTLSGTTESGANVCTMLTSVGLSCTLTSATDGTFAYAGLPASNASGYLLVETQPVDYANGTDAVGTACGPASCGTASVVSGNSRFATIKLAAGADAINYLFGEKTGAISGFVYLDTNNDGIKDTGETGIAGVTMTLSGLTATGAAACTSCTATTAVDGSYSFTGLKNANASGYTVTETQPGSYIDGKETAGTQLGTVDNATFTSDPAKNKISTILFNAANVATAYNFGEVQIGSISGRVYHDQNDNLIYEAGEKLANVTLKLTGDDDQGIAVDAINPITVTTDASGNYSFADLRPSGVAGYTITETQPAGIGEFAGVTGTQVGTIGGSPIGEAALLNVISAIVLPSGSAGINYNFREQASSLEGYVYRDDNDDGFMQTTEAIIAGVTMTLKDSSGTTLKVTTTDAAGKFLFIGLASGNYTIEETQPAAFLDGKETVVGTSGGVAANTGFDSTAANNSISTIVLLPATNATGYLFGERGGRLNGFVYADINNNGIKDTGEAGIAGIDITLSGASTSGVDITVIRTPANCKSTTDTNGAFTFDGIPPGSYTLLENHNQVNLILDNAGAPKYKDGKETAGVAGGVVDNTYFDSQSVYNTISSIQITSTVITANAGNIGGYLFGEPLRPNNVGLITPIVSGYVYFDTTHTRVRGNAVADPLAEGWDVTLTASKSDGSTEIICTVKSDTTGYYHLDNLSCLSNYPHWANGLPTSGSSAGGGQTYTTFSVGFVKSGQNGGATAPQSGGNAGSVNVSTGKITGITLNSGTEIVEQNLPLDPQGVVYDANTRNPVAGATVTLINGGVAVPTSCLVGGVNAQVTGVSGLYQFLLINPVPGGCPGSGIYAIQVVQPAGYLPPESNIIPSTVGPHTPVGPAGGVEAIQPQVGPPTGAIGIATTYYFSFNLTLGAAGVGVVNNHIPLDPIQGGAITITKTSPLVNVSRGDLVPYTITATNTLSSTLRNIDVHDQVPPGFKYKRGTASVDGLASEPIANGRDLTWANLEFTASQKHIIRLMLVVGSGVAEGEYVNTAFALNNLVNKGLSNTATATVRVIPDPTFDCSDLIGKVFDDQNANGYQDEGEPGIANVRLATVNGLLVTTDDQGRFHVTCADVPNEWRGSNFLMKLDERTLPTGFRVTTENPRDVRLTRGKMSKLNFGATIHRVVRLDITDAAFEADVLKAEWLAQLERLPETLKTQPSILRIAYKQGAEGEVVAKKRLKAISAKVKAMWQAKNCCHLLQIEEELIQPSPAKREAK